MNIHNVSVYIKCIHLFWKSSWKNHYAHLSNCKLQFWKVTCISPARVIQLNLAKKICFSKVNSVLFQIMRWSFNILLQNSHEKYMCQQQHPILISAVTCIYFFYLACHHDHQFGASSNINWMKNWNTLNVYLFFCEVIKNLQQDQEKKEEAC